jgi:dTDP-4-dehydrorhamnose reductase
MRVMILGASGMLGSAMFRVFSEDSVHETYGTARAEATRRHFTKATAQRLMTGVDVERPDALPQALAIVRPQFVVNCIGLVKQVSGVNDPLQAAALNAVLPHRLAALCHVIGARLVHISTDCVFSGAKGHYREIDLSDASDNYGRTKLLGEVDYPHAITLRTSIIGHELVSSHGLINWFLAQEGHVKGFRKAIFSGLPTVELSRVVRDFVVPRTELRGVYHVASKPIDKCALLQLVAKVYGKEVRVVPHDELVVDRSLNADRFTEATGYVVPSWPELIRRMHEFK